MIVLILSSMLLLTMMGSFFMQPRKEKKTEPETEESLPEEVVIPSSFAGTLNDPYGVPKEIMETITRYMDAYYLSIFTLDPQDVDSCFSDEKIASVSENAIRLVVENRKMYDFDFTMKKAHYDLSVTRYEVNGDKYYIDLLEDDHMNFAFLNGIESIAYEIENYFTLVNVDGKYLISDLDKIQGYYMPFYEAYQDGRQLDEVYSYYYRQLKDMLAYNTEILKIKAENEPYESNIGYIYAYDRQAVAAYADQYAHKRNEEWYNFTDEGGNCQNYASQAMLAGGIRMDYEGDWQWKCYMEDSFYDPGLNEDEVPYGRSRSWVGVGYFYSYALNNRGTGLAADVNANLYYAQPGDLILVGNNSLAHTTIVSKVVDGHILVDSNSIDMTDYPVEAYTYTTIMLIKILGSN